MTEKTDPFDVEVKRIIVGSRTLEIRPIPLKPFKVAIRIVGRLLTDIRDAAAKRDTAITEDIPEIIVEGFKQLAPYIFHGQDVTPEFVEENFTVPMCRETMLMAAKINGTTDFFDQLRRGMSAPAEATPPSTTTSGSPTVGPQDRSTS